MRTNVPERRATACYFQALCVEGACTRFTNRHLRPYVLQTVSAFLLIYSARFSGDTFSSSFARASLQAQTSSTAFPYPISLLHRNHGEFFRCADIDDVIVSVLEINGVESVDASVVYQMLAVEAYDVFYTVDGGNGNMAAVVVYPQRFV